MGTEYWNGAEAAHRRVMMKAASLEAYDGGNIALVENGDEIVIDIPNGEVSMLVSEEELAERRERWVCPPLKEQKGCLNIFARMCRPAEEGGAMQPWGIDARFHE